MNQIFAVKYGVLMDGRPMVKSGEIPEITLKPVHIELSSNIELFILPPDWNARGYFTEFYCARGDIVNPDLDLWLAGGGL